MPHSGNRVKSRISHISHGSGHTEEHAMGRRLYYRDSYGRVRRDRQAGRTSSGRSASGGSAIPARFFILVLRVLTVLVALASVH